MKSGKIWIGTSGWDYKHWQKVFYPEDLKKDRKLEFYASHLPTVELNNSFYRQPDQSLFNSWSARVPDSFCFAVKANRYFTHLKKLKVSQADVMDFLKKCDGMEDQLGPVLFQLPPKWKINTERLEGFLSILPKTYRFAFEFREQSWYTPEVYQLLEKYDCAFCIYHLAGHLSPVLATTGFVYIRLHGPGDKYQGSYHTKDLTDWAERCNVWLAEGKDIYLYFDNDEKGYAVQNALQFSQIIKNTSIPVDQ